LGLDGLGHAERFADYSQWETWQSEQLAAEKKAAAAQQAVAAPWQSTGVAKKKLSYKEARELETIEQRIADAEKELQARHEVLLDPAVTSDALRLRTISLEMESAQKTIDALYARWAELEAKL
jgi:ABC transport system ATP-binding/permease protein